VAVCGCGCGRVFAGDLGGPATVSRISDLDEGTKFIFFLISRPPEGGLFRLTAAPRDIITS